MVRGPRTPGAHMLGHSSPVPFPRSRAGVALVAVVAFLLGTSSVAVAAAVVTSRTIKNDTIKPVDLNFVVGQEAAHVTTPVVLSSEFTQVLQTTMTVDDGGGLAVAQADLSLTNSGGSPVLVTLRLTHKQDPDHTESYDVTVPANSA